MRTTSYVHNSMFDGQVRGGSFHALIADGCIHSAGIRCLHSQ